ncbi:MAG: ABC transporter ATP-binding protein [Phenylobacterium sp.]|uniref:ABC transporter ATP-binding protein n=1 Tax=Phenylobacterium sp. TaxID=1871053 RepID=UPI001B77239F|nr:ABC transporter ATP-binding protein [Phenylobacterium sp.]MBP7817451.1 ABC transporter ATP-binding protein [Phenylobacterium sp.]MBP9229952.1 ABC transporter ATP-binding protein [Phenylobacterium sp.]MBP9753965.1 ABC transporter ATP-binding protein [Phenylobacterium sp.]
MSDSHPSRRGAATAASAPIQVDVKTMPRVLQRIVGLAFHYPWLVALAMAASLGAALASLALPRLLGRAVDQAHGLLLQGATHADQARQALLITAGLVIGATIVRGAMTMWAGYLGELVSQKVGHDLRLQFFQQLQRLSFGFHDRIHSGDLVTRGMLDLEGARVFIQGGMMPILTLVLLLVFASWQMLAIDQTLGLIGLAFVPFSALALGRMGFLLRVTWLRFQELMAQLTLTMEENLQGIRVVRAFAGKAFEMAKFDQASVDALAYSYNRITLRFRAVAVMQVTFNASMAGVLWYGGHKVAAGTMSVGTLTAYLTYMTLLQGPIRQIAMIFNAAARATSSGARVFEVLDLEPEIADAPDANPLAPTKGVLRFESVDFGYVPGKQILTGIDFEVGPGQTLGIVGPPGSGKSTIANLIPRFYEVTGGAITIDGVDIRDVTLPSLREYVGLVQQEAFLFDSSIGHNVAYADPWAEEERIVGAAKTAQIHEHIVGLPADYETRVGERGVALSGGQRQRMSIARGVVPGPGVMIFDDSTAAIDAVTERRVRDALSEATRTKATIIIAHRLSSLMHADQIIVLDEGVVVERGTHAQLLEAGGVYADLYELQSRSDASATLDDVTLEGAPA